MPTGARIEPRMVSSGFQDVPRPSDAPSASAVFRSRVSIRIAAVARWPRASVSWSSVTPWSRAASRMSSRNRSSRRSRSRAGIARGRGVGGPLDVRLLRSGPGVERPGARAGEAAEAACDLGQALLHALGPVAPCEVLLHLTARRSLHLLAGPAPAPPWPGGAPARVLTGPAGLVLRPARLLLPLLLGPAQLLLRRAPGLLVPEAGSQPLRPAPATAVTPGRRAHLAAQLARRAAHVVADLGGQFGDGLADLQLQLGQLPAAPASSARPASVIE